MKGSWNLDPRDPGQLDPLKLSRPLCPLYTLPTAAPAPPCSVPSASHRHGKAAPGARQSPRRAGQCLGERGRRAGLCAHGDQAGAVTKRGRVSGDLRKTSSKAGGRARSGGPRPGPAGHWRCSCSGAQAGAALSESGRGGGRQGGPALDYPSGMPEQAGAFTLAPRPGSSPRWPWCPSPGLTGCPALPRCTLTWLACPCLERRPL